MVNSTMTSTPHSTPSRDPVSSSPTANASEAYDLVCVGFGPAQIATAIANDESRKSCKVLFLEKKPSFSWHPSAQLPRTRMENPFIYDLATIRNPRSKFSYQCYLLSQDRLIEFANSDRLQPLRVEFEHYLGWCAEQFKAQVRYNSEVVGVVPEKGANSIRRWNVAVRDQDGKTYVVRAKNILVPSPSEDTTPRARPLTSVDFLAGQRIISMDEYTTRRNELRQPRDTRLNIALVGSGEQTIEVLDDLLSCYRLGNVTLVTENESLAPLRILGDDASPPQPRLCSIWAKPSCEPKSSITRSSELIQSIYARAYEKQVASKGQFALRVVIGRDAAEPTSKADFIISEHAVGSLKTSSALFHGLDALVLGCRQKGESLEEVQFKRGAVAEGCRMWMMSANSEGGRSLAKDLAVRAGEVVNALSTVTAEEQDGVMMINARM
jgi:L-ornithine N5-oxygenase